HPLVRISVIRRHTPLVAPVEIHLPPIDRLRRVGRQALVAGPGRVSSGQREGEEVLGPVPERFDDHLGKAAGNVLGHLELSVQRPHPAATVRAASYRASRPGWVSAVVRSRGVSAPRWGTATRTSPMRASATEPPAPSPPGGAPAPAGQPEPASRRAGRPATSRVARRCPASSGAGVSSRTTSRSTTPRSTSHAASRREDQGGPLISTAPTAGLSGS